MSKPRLMYVEWDDHCSSNGWRFPNEIEACGVRLKSVGFVVKENKKALVLAVTIDPRDKQSTARQYIMKSCIVKKRRVREP